MSYDPTTGRFTSQDPIAFESGDTNLYRFTDNDPTNETDPTGDEGVFQSGMPAQAGEAVGTAIATGVASVVGTGMGLGTVVSYTTATVLATGIINAGQEDMEGTYATILTTSMLFFQAPSTVAPTGDWPPGSGILYDGHAMTDAEMALRIIAAWRKDGKFTPIPLMDFPRSGYNPGRPGSPMNPNPNSPPTSTNPADRPIQDWLIPYTDPLPSDSPFLDPLLNLPTQMQNLNPPGSPLNSSPNLPPGPINPNLPPGPINPNLPPVPTKTLPR